MPFNFLPDDKNLPNVQQPTSWFSTQNTRKHSLARLPKSMNLGFDGDAG